MSMTTVKFREVFDKGGKNCPDLSDLLECIKEPTDSAVYTAFLDVYFIRREGIDTATDIVEDRDTSRSDAKRTISAWLSDVVPTLLETHGEIIEERFKAAERKQLKNIAAVIGISVAGGLAIDIINGISNKIRKKIE